MRVAGRVGVEIAWHGAAAVAAAGTLLPWSRTGGRTRSGFDTAEVLLTLAGDGLPAGVGWIARGWYLGVAAVLAAWAIATIGKSQRSRRVARGLCVLALVLVLATAVLADRQVGVSGFGTGPVTTGVGVTMMWLLATRGGSDDERYVTR